MHKMIHAINTLIDPETGELSFLEFSDLPWEPKRIYWLKSLDLTSTRGNHAHKDLSQIFILISGSLTIEIFDGSKSKNYELNRESGQLLVEPGYWRVIRNASPDAVLLVLADRPYDESDYIRNLDDYLQWHEESKK